MECIICCNEFTKKLKRPVECPKCKFTTCYQCMSNYFIERTKNFTELKCMDQKCELIWDREIFYNIFGKYWVTRYFTDYNKNLLFQKQKAKFEETLVHRKAYVLIHELYKKRQRSKREEHLELLKPFNNEIHNLIDRNSEYYKHSQSYEKNVERMLRRLYWESEKQKKDIELVKKRKLFFGNCSYNECDGLIKKNGECSTCQKKTCRDCREKILDEDQANSQIEHKCDPNILENIKYIKKSTHSCPKCGMSVQRVEGCDLMWCTLCHIFFNWSNNKIVKKGGHNPHYLEWASRNGVDVVGIQCGYVLLNNRTHILNKKIYDFGSIDKPLLKINNELHYLFRHLSYFRTLYNASNVNVKIAQAREQYLIGDIDKKRFLTIIMMNDKKQERYIKFQEIIDMLMTGLSNMSNWYHDIIRNSAKNKKLNNKTLNSTIIEYHEKVKDLINKCNVLFQNIGTIYLTGWPIINTHYENGNIHRFEAAFCNGNKN